MNADMLFEILKKDKPSLYIKQNENNIFKIIPELKECKGFNQNNIWHIYDVYEHILHVIDGVSPKLVIRLAALFHDIGKPYVYKEDENKVGHFYGHWDKSTEIFNKFAKENNINIHLFNTVSKLITYHDIRISKLSDEELTDILINFNLDELNLLFELRRSDLLAQNPKFHYLIDDYKKEEIKLLNLINNNKRKKE